MLEPKFYTSEGQEINLVEHADRLYEYFRNLTHSEYKTIVIHGGKSDEKLIYDIENNLADMDQIYKLYDRPTEFAFYMQIITDFLGEI